MGADVLFSAGESSSHGPLCCLPHLGEMLSPAIKSKLHQLAGWSNTAFQFKPSGVWQTGHYTNYTNASACPFWFPHVPFPSCISGSTESIFFSYCLLKQLMLEPIPAAGFGCMWAHGLERKSQYNFSYRADQIISSLPPASSSFLQLQQWICCCLRWESCSALWLLQMFHHKQSSTYRWWVRKLCDHRPPSIFFV